MRSSRRGIAHAAAGRARGGRSIGIRILDVKMLRRFPVDLSVPAPPKLPRDDVCGQPRPRASGSVLGARGRRPGIRILLFSEIEKLGVPVARTLLL